MARSSNSRAAASSATWIPGRTSALRIALAYAVVGSLWILFSGELLHQSVQDHALAVTLESIKGWFFVAVTAFLLWLVLDRYLAQIRRSARLLEESEARWQHALEGAGDGVWDWDVPTHQVFYSRTWKAMLGYAPHEIGNTLAEWESRLHPADRDRVLQEVRRHLEGKTASYVSEHRLLCKNGTYAWMLDSGKVVQRAADGTALRVIGTHKDITERKHAEAAVWESEARYRGLFEAETDAVLLVDQNTDEILDANPAALRLYGYPREEILGLKSLQLSAEPEKSRLAIAARESFVAGRLHRRKDGSVFPVEASRSYFELQGRAVHVAAFRDISDRQRAEAALRESEERLRLVGDNLPDSYIYQAVREPDGRRHFTYVSAGVERVHGLSVAQVMQQPDLLLQSIEPRLATAYAEAEERSARELSDFAMVLEMRQPSGEARSLYVRSRPRRTPAGQVLWDGVATDFTERRRIEVERQRWSDAFEHCAQGLGIEDASTNRIMACNPALMRMVVRSAGELAEAPVLSLYAAQDHDQVRNSLAQADREGNARYEARMVRSDGSVFPVQMDVVSVRDSAGTVLYRVATAEDITVRNKALEEIRHRLDLQEQLARIAETVPGLIFSFRLRPDGSACLPFATAAIEDLFGVSPEQAREDFAPAMERLDPADRPRVQESITTSARRMEAWRETFRVHHPRRGMLWLEGHSVPRRDPDGSILWHGFVQDVTERKRAEGEVRASEQRFRTLVESAPIAIFVQVGGRFAYLNRSAAALFAASSADELVGSSVLERFHPDLREQVRDRIHSLNIERRPVPSAEQRCLRLDGSEFEADFSAVPFDYDGQPGALVFFHEITGRKNLEAQLRQAQKLESVGQLAGGIAHDFNNILAAVLMHVGMMQMQARENEELRSGLNELEALTRRAASLTRQLLMFSRRSVLAMKPVNLNEITANLLKMLNRLIGETIDLRFEGSGALPPVEADSGMLDQVVMNLVVNARDAMPRGGRIRISTSVVDLGTTEAGGNPERRVGRFVCLAVSDTGCGIDPETMKRIFEPFFTTKSKGAGTGLGLATVHGIVKQHKGWVEVESEPDRGSTFRVFLPAMLGPVEEGALPSPQPPAQRGTEGVMLVEDDVNLRRLTALSLRALGYRVYEAGSGQEAMRLWEAHNAAVEVLLTDMVMPEGITGLELTERLQGARPGLKAIIMSGYSPEMVRAGVPDKPGVVYLPKPFDTRVLAETVRRLLDPTTGSGRAGAGLSAP